MLINSHFWDDKFSPDEYVYGEKPNDFLNSSLVDLKPGSILFPGDGEGRNSVFAASLGWEVDALDWSVKAKHKAEMLAAKNNVTINYSASDFINSFNYEKKYDAIALIYLHLPSEVRAQYFSKLPDILNPGGKIILELFSKGQLGKNSGGPNNIDLLYSLEDVISDFIKLDFVLLEENEIVLDEGKLHSGPASVIRFIGQKPLK